MSNTRMYQYKCLCEKTANDLLKDRDNQSLNILFEGCTECKEINLWTYWHGRKSLDEQNDSVHPKILLVGQDWGCYTASNNIVIGKQIALVENNPAKYIKTFCSLNNGTTTDNNLKNLFCAIGYDLDIEQSDLFFTNLIPYYRKRGVKISGFKRNWLTPSVQENFRKLIKILEPKAILCLGKNTYHGVLDSLGVDKGDLMKKTYNSFLDSGNNFQISTDYKCTVFALGHCGGLGIRNRSMNEQIKDWELMKKSII